MLSTAEQQEGDREDSRQQNLAAESNHNGEADVVLLGEDGQEFNKKSNKGEEGVPHNQSDFELKGLHKEKWESFQECEKDKAVSGPSKKLCWGFGPPVEWAQ